jgi:Protein of unknown function (DUF3099)
MRHRPGRSAPSRGVCQRTAWGIAIREDVSREDQALVAVNGQGPDEPAGPQPSRRDKRFYLALMTLCIGMFVLSWAVLDRFSSTAAIVVSAIALVIPPFAVIIANVASAVDRRRP